MKDTRETLGNNHYDRLQNLLEEGLRAIATARTATEADQARQDARERLADLIQLRQTAPVSRQAG